MHTKSVLVAHTTLITPEVFSFVPGSVLFGGPCPPVDLPGEYNKDSQLEGINILHDYPGVHQHRHRKGTPNTRVQKVCI